jgi:spore coat polysaccharide biosynthesis protein SpsF
MPNARLRQRNEIFVRNVCIIQARMGSSRLAGKVLKPLAGRAALDWVVLRTRAAQAFAEIVLATTTEPQDDPLADHGARLGVRVVRGSEVDVLDRYRKAAADSQANVITRITSDCPLIEPALLASMAARFQAPLAFDVLTNAVQRTFPRGLDTEMFTRAALDAAAEEARDPAEREHVTVFLYRRPQRFRIEHVTQPVDRSQERWTLDTPEDYALLSRIFDAAGDPLALTQDQVLSMLDANPGWRALNAHIEQKKP